MSITNGCLEQYVARGWRTVPVHRPDPTSGQCSCGKPDCPKPGKHPDGRFWPGDSTEPGHYANRNLGVRLGPDSQNLADVDLDCGEAMAIGSLLLPATDCMFGRGGQPTHALFTITDAAATFVKLLDPVLSSDAATIIELRWPGWDDGKNQFKAIQTVFPPSLHFSGTSVEWIRDGEPGRVLGADLVAAVHQLGAAVLIARYTKPKERHALVLLIANLLARAGWTDDAKIVRFMTAVFTAKNDADKVGKIAAGEGLNAVKDARTRLQDGRPMTGIPALKEMLDPALDIPVADKVIARITAWLDLPSTPGVTASSQRGGETGPISWPQPVPLTIAPNVLPYPVGILSPWIQTWADAVALELQVPIDLPAGLGLGFVAAGLARKVVVRPRPGFTEPTNLFVMVALPPGDRKTQTFRRAIAPVQKLQHEARVAAGPTIIEAESQHRIAEKKVKHLEDKIAKGADPSERAQLQEDLKLAREELAEAEVPPSPVFYTEDDTPEALKQELIRQGGRMVVATTEARCLENITFYSDRPNFDVYLKGHAGDEMNSGRVSRGREMVTEPALSCLLSPQPAVLQGLAEDEILRGRGFLARWLFGLPRSRVGSRQVAAPAVPEAVLAEYERRMRAVWAIDYARDEEGNTTPHVIRFTPEAASTFEEFECWIEPQLAPGASLARLAGWGNKLNGACARIAASLHAADAVGQGRDWRTPITVEVVERAIRLCREYLIPHAIAAFDLMGTDATLSGARRIWNWVCEKCLTEFTKRDCFRALAATFETVDHLQQCLDLLERHYLIRTRERERTGRGRPASAVYTVNPQAGSEEHRDPSTCPSTPPPDSNSVISVISVSGGAPPIASGTKPANDRNDCDSPIVERQSRAASRSRSHTDLARTSLTEMTELTEITSDVFEGSSNVEFPAGTSLTEMTELTEIPPDSNSVISVISVSGRLSSVGVTLVTDRDAFEVLMGVLKEWAQPVALDTETTGLDPSRDRVRLLQLAVSDTIHLIDLFAFPDPAGTLAPLFTVLAQKEIVGHNLAFDLQMLAPLGFIPGRVFDTLLASRILHAGDREANQARLGHSLGEVVARELGRSLDKSLQRSDWSGPLTAAQLAYAAADAALLLPLAENLKAQLAAADLTTTATLEMRALPGIAWACPVSIDPAAWLTLAHHAECRQRELAEEMDQLAPNGACLPGAEARNWNSTDDIRTAFADHGIALDSTDDAALAAIDHPLAGLLREYRGVTKRAGTYGRNWLTTHVGADGRVRPSWNPLGAESGRMSCSDPNLQQIPRGSDYRRCLVAPPGHVLVKADYSQVELRIAAKVAEEQVMIAAYRNGGDLHRLTAARVLGKPEDEVTPADRQIAKSLNFGLLYGMGWRGLRGYSQANYGVNLTDAQAREYRDAFFRAYPGLARWHRRVRRDLDRLFQADPTGTHAVRTLGGRRRMLPVAKRRNDGAAYPNVTEALNTPVQGSGADGLKVAIARLWESRAECPGAVPVLFCHDEIVLQVPEADVEPAKRWLERCLAESMAPLIDPVPVAVDVTVGRTWGG